MKTLAKLALAAFLAAGSLIACSEQAAVNSEQSNSVQPRIAYVASVNREPFHRPGCSSAARISSANLRTFQTREDAIKAGHRPCKVCKP